MAMSDSEVKRVCHCLQLSGFYTRLQGLARYLDDEVRWGHDQPVFDLVYALNM